MNRRLELHKVLVNALGSKNVYFQPPESVRMTYPCIVYGRNSDSTIYADNQRYRSMKRYTVTVIDKNPDSEIPDRIRELPLCKFDRHYATENLNHDAFTIYY